MAAIFNPPPGWPIEPGFVPSDDWQPDPEWPPAPPGWQFWIAENTEPARTLNANQTTRTKTLLAAVAVIVTVGAIAAAIVTFTRSHPAPTDSTTNSVGGVDKPIISSGAAPPPVIPAGPATPPITDADAHGFVVFGEGARCAGSDNAVMFMRTENSALVVCRSDINQLYYRGYRISDGASIELHDVGTQPGGFVAVNAPDNARYVITTDGFQLIQNDAVVVSESALETGPPGWAANRGDSSIPAAPPTGVVVLGGDQGVNATGYGTQKPSSISLGSCANTIDDIVWEGWGSSVAHGTGKGCVQSGEPPDYGLVASDLGLCNGVLAYRKLAFSASGEPQSICGG